MDYYRKQLKENKIVNKKLLSKFEGYLSSIDFPEMEISKNVFNAAFYINIYLTKDEIISAVKGYKEIHKFTDCFLKEATWSLLKDLQAGMNSVKLFYDFLYKSHYIDEENYLEVAKFVDKDIPEFIKKYEDNEELLLKDYVLN